MLVLPCERVYNSPQLNLANHELFRIPENSANRFEMGWVELSCKRVHIARRGSTEQLS
jgi:hypothetical protein